VTAVEHGAALAAQARANLAGHPVEVVNRRFEDWNAQPGEFAAVVAATAWHWLDPDLRYGRAARALRPGGHLAIWSAQHVFPVGGDPFFEELQEVYDQIGEAPPEGAPRPAPGELPEMTDEIRATGQFQMVSVDHFDWTVDYTAETYIDLLRTFSGHIAMAPADRDRLFSEIRRRVALRIAPRWVVEFLVLVSGVDHAVSAAGSATSWGLVGGLVMSFMLASER
jgi:SAM-dependent methyltransferase